MIEKVRRDDHRIDHELDARGEALEIAPRVEDEAGNDLRGARRFSLETAPSDTANAFLPTGRLVADLPVTYRRYIYDASYNLAGFWNMYAGASLGYAADEPALGRRRQRA